MVRILTGQDGRKEYSVNQDDLDFFFGEVMGRVMRSPLPAPQPQLIQAMPEPAMLPSPPPQRLLMPGPDVLPDPHPSIMPPSYDRTAIPQPITAPVRIAKPSLVQIAIALALSNRRFLAMAGLGLAGTVFLLFAGSFVVRQVTPEVTTEVGPVEAIGDPEVQGVEEAPAEEAPPAEPPAEAAPAMQFPTFPAIPR